MSLNVTCEAPSEKIRVIRFLRPDVRPALYDGDGSIADTTLYKEMSTEAIAEFPEGGVLVLNFGLIDWFPTAFYRVLIQALQDIRAKAGRVVVCCLPAIVKEGFELMGGNKLFATFTSEAKAIAGVKN